MSDELATLLRGWERRRRWVSLGLWLPRGLLAGGLSAAAVAAWARFRPILTPPELAWLTLGWLGLGALAALATALWPRRALSRQARWADAHFGLQERAGTAVEIGQGQISVSAEWAALQLADTLRAARRVEARRQLPWRWSRRDLALLALTLVLLLLAVWLPNPQTGPLLRQRAITRTLAEQTTALETLSAELAQNPALTADQRAALLAPIQDALSRLQTPGLDQAGAVAALSQAESALRALAAADDGAALADAGLGPTPGPALAALADNLPSLSPTEQAALADALQTAAGQLAAADAALTAQLSQAADALRGGDLAAAQSALRDAAAPTAAAQAAGAAADQLAAGRQAIGQAGLNAAPSASADPTGQAAASGQPGSAEQPGSSGQTGSSGQPGEGQGAGGASDNGAPGVGGPSRGGGHTENVYVPPLVDLSGAPGVEVQLPAECGADCAQLAGQTAAPFRDQAGLTPYDQVFGDYRDRAYAALDDAYIPLGLKAAVRDYFTALEP